VFCEETKIKHDLKGIDCRYRHLLRTTNTKHSLELIAGSISFLRRSKHKASTGIDLAGYIDF
jgi:hypothetical protein